MTEEKHLSEANAVGLTSSAPLKGGKDAFHRGETGEIEELFRIPYEAAESDAIRYALIYHNGGVGSGLGPHAHARGVRLGWHEV